MSDFNCIVAGAGVIGLAIARELALAGRDVLVIEKESRIGTGMSARNSEVIHAGLYYPPGSLKSRLCVAGRGKLYDYCGQQGIPHRRLGKLIVAIEAEQVEKLEAIRVNAARCGVDDPSMLTREEALAFEPALECVAALWSPSTGIVDGHALMHSLLGDAEAHGAAIALRTSVEHVSADHDGVQVHTRGCDGQPFSVAARCIVNATGLDAPTLASRIEGFPREKIPRQRLARGSYFELSGRSPFSHLIYPVPVDGGLGIHLTLDLNGEARFGPDVEWIETIDYAVNPTRTAAFESEIAGYWPNFAPGELRPAYAGIRPKLSGPGEAPADFLIQGPSDHGAGPIVNLFGIESPGLTSSLAMADYVADLLDEYCS